MSTALAEQTPRATRVAGGRAQWICRASAQTCFVLAASGHIASMINPPSKGKGGYWTNDTLPPPASADAWLADAHKHDGSWWTDLAGWLGARSGEKIPAPPVGSAAHPPIGDAPGTYVLEK